jgi:hypothetical protein
LERLEDSKQETAAQASGIDKGTLSNFKNGKGCIKAAQLRLLLSHLGLKLVPAESVCINRIDYLSMSRTAGRALLENPEQFLEEDPE